MTSPVHRHEFFTRTIWRGISFDHPEDWELSAISRIKQTERLTFADRHYERLRLTWRPVPHEPDLRAIMDNQIAKESPEGAEKLRNLPGSWLGALVPKGPIRFTYAACFMPSPQLLMEAVLVWPGMRDKSMESAILKSIAPASNDGNLRRWAAMGIDLKAPDKYELVKWQALVGKVEWHFSIPELKEGIFTIQRLAMPDHWLKKPLEEWLQSQVEKGATKETPEQIHWNGHIAWRMSSIGPVNPLLRLLGKEPSRMDLAWECPNEKRVYHLTWKWRGVEKNRNLPDDVSIACCNPPAIIHYAHSQPPILLEGLDDSERPGNRKIETPQTALNSHVYRNEAMQTEDRSDGGLTVSIPVKQLKVLKPPLKWILPYSTSRRVVIDQLSKELLELCDGHRTAEDIIIAFAKAHLLTFREASLPVVRQLLSLSERGIVVLVGESTSDDKPSST